MEGTSNVLHSSDSMNAQILLELGKLSSQVASMSVDIAVIKNDLKDLPDHENRIRKLEAWRYGLPISGIIAIGSAALSVYELMHH